MTQWSDYFNNIPEELHLPTLKDLKYGRVMSDWSDLVFCFWLKINEIEQAIGIPKTEWWELKPAKGKDTHPKLWIQDGHQMLGKFQQVCGSKLELSGCDDYNVVHDLLETAMDNRHRLAHHLLLLSQASAFGVKQKTNEKPSVHDVIVQQIEIIDICEKSISNARSELKCFLQCFLDKAKSEI